MAVGTADALMAPALPARDGATWKGMGKKANRQKIKQLKEKLIPRRDKGPHFPSPICCERMMI